LKYKKKYRVDWLPIYPVK